MFLVKDLLSHLGMKETLAIFEAESGVNVSQESGTFNTFKSCHYLF